MSRLFRDPVSRSKSLLYDFLTEAQKRDLQRNDGFNVRGGDGKLYRLTTHGEHNIIPQEGWARCIFADGYGSFTRHEAFDHHLPIYDTLLAQMFWIQKEGWRFVSKGCSHDPPGTSAQRVRLNDYGGLL